MNTKIIQTKDYNKFNTFKENRPINLKHVKNLIDSIKKFGLLEEITINENYEIIDGQHRFLALKELFLPIEAKVKKGYNLDSVIPCNLTRIGWSLKDFLNYYARMGIKDYLLLEDVLSLEKELSITSTIYLYHKTGKCSIPEYKNGKYEIDVAYGNYLRNILTELEPIMFKNAYHQKFARPLTTIIKNNKNFNLKRLKSQAKKYKINIYSTQIDTYKGIIEIYNKNLTKENRIF